MRAWPLLIVGQAPSVRTTPGFERQEALVPDGEGTTADRLLRLFGCRLDAYMEMTERINLFEEYPGTDGKGDRFNAAVAASMAEHQWGKLAGRRTLIVGNAVAWAFGARGPMLTWNRELHGDVAWLPHTSGINRWWNSAANRAAAEAFMRPLGQEIEHAFQSKHDPETPGEGDPEEERSDPG